MRAPNTSLCTAGGAQSCGANETVWDFHEDDYEQVRPALVLGAQTNLTYDVLLCTARQVMGLSVRPRASNWVVRSRDLQLQEAAGQHDERFLCG